MKLTFDHGLVFAILAGTLVLCVWGLWCHDLIGWRLTPRRDGQGAPEEWFEIEDYINEVIVPEEARLVGHQSNALIMDSGYRFGD